MSPARTTKTPTYEQLAEDLPGREERGSEKLDRGLHEADFNGVFQAVFFFFFKDA